LGLRVGGVPPVRRREYRANARPGYSASVAASSSKASETEFMQ
jgi:hypothetical protein